MNKREQRIADNRKKHEALVATFEARVMTQDPNDPLTADPMWNPRHPDFNPEPGAISVTQLMHDEPAPTPPRRGGGGGRKATPKQLHWLRTKLGETRLLGEPFIMRIKAMLDNAEDVPFTDAKKALDILFNEPRPNKYDGDCRTCGGRVPAGTGGLEKVDGRWTTFHLGECPSTQPEPQPEPEPAVSLDLRARIPVGKNRFADPRHITDPDASDLTRLKVQVDVVAQDARSKWAGWVFVKDAAEYGAGKRYGRQRPGERYDGQVDDFLTRVVADPETAARAYGKITGRCSRCNAKLEDETSVALGIGPVCRTKFNF